MDLFANGTNSWLGITAMQRPFTEDANHPTVLEHSTRSRNRTKKPGPSRMKKLIVAVAKASAMVDPVLIVFKLAYSSLESFVPSMILEDAERP
jgi:hypothetical protein